MKLNFIKNTFYGKLYKRIIFNALFQKRIKSKNNYYEAHHILPRCLYPEYEDSKDNLVLLTGREHYLCHYILTKIYPNNDKLHYAFHMMHVTSNNQSRYFNSYGYEISKKKRAEMQRQKWILDNPNNYRDISGKNNPMYGSNRIGETNPFFGKKHSEETKLKISLANSNRNISDETREKLRDVWKNRQLLKCPYCLKESKSISNMKRYHFDKCLLR
jgi:hypothetical protein